MTPIETERTIIEPITLDDAPFFVSLMNSPGWLQFIGDRNIETSEDARRYLENSFLRSYAENGFGYYLVREKSSHEPIGTCGFLKKPTLENPDFGFAYLPDYAGRGYASESCRAVLNYGIGAFGFEVLDAVTMPQNVRSIRLLERLGFDRQTASIGSAPDDELLLFRWHNTLISV